MFEQDDPALNTDQPAASVDDTSVTGVVLPKTAKTLSGLYLDEDYADAGRTLP